MMLPGPIAFTRMFSLARAKAMHLQDPTAPRACYWMSFFPSVFLPQPPFLCCTIFAMLPWSLFPCCIAYTTELPLGIYNLAFSKIIQKLHALTKLIR